MIWLYNEFQVCEGLSGESEANHNPSLDLLESRIHTSARLMSKRGPKRAEAWSTELNSMPKLNIITLSTPYILCNVIWTLYGPYAFD